MLNVHVAIDGVLLYCDESITGINLGNGYTITKKPFDELSFKIKVTDGAGRLSINYMGSRIFDSNDNVYLMCIHKEDIYQVSLPEINVGESLTDEDLMCNEQLVAYKEKEMEFLNKTTNLLHIYKAGNIGFKEVFFEHKFTVMGFINNACKQTSDSITRNIIDSRVYSLTTAETTECTNFLNSVTEQEYLMLKNCIDEFVWGLEQVDLPTGFEQYTTTLEMVLLSTSQGSKKEMLAKRVSALLETDVHGISAMYDKMKLFYRFRSESLHEGDGSNITNAELIELEDVVRRVLKKYLAICKAELQANPAKTWDEIKDEKITELKGIVVQYINAGILP